MPGSNVSMPYLAVPLTLKGMSSCGSSRADHGVLIRRLQLDRLQVVGREGLRRLAGLDDVREADRLARFCRGDPRIVDHDSRLAGRRASPRRASVKRDAPGGARAAHRVEVHHRAPAAAGDVGAEHRIVELRIVADQIDAHVVPGRAEFFGDDLRHRAGDVLAHVGLADIDCHDAVRRRSSTRCSDRRQRRLQWPQTLSSRRAARRTPKTRPAAPPPTRNERRERSAPLAL